MEVGVGTVDLDRFVPDHRLQALLGLPVKLDEGRFAFGIDEAERVDTKALHCAKGARDRAIRHGPHDHVKALRRQADKVPEIIVRGLRLGEGAIRLGLGRMDEVWKLNRILDEKDGDIVADKVPVALLRIELDREAPNVASEVEGAFRARDSREADESRRLLAHALEDVCAADVGQTVGQLEEAVGTVAARVNDPFGDALMVEMEDFLAEVEVLQERWAACALLQAVLVICDRDAVLGGEGRDITTYDLMGIAARGLRLGERHGYHGVGWDGRSLLRGLPADVRSGQISGRYRCLAGGRLGCTGFLGHVGSSV